MSDVGHQLLSGALAGFASTICLQPFDLIKTRLQQTDVQLDTRQNRGVVGTVRNVLASDGVRGLWRGTVPSLFRAVPGVAMYMTTLTHVRGIMAASPLFLVAGSRSTSAASGSVLPKLTTEGNLLSGAVTRIAVSFVLNPFSVLKARFESDIYRQHYQSFPSAVVSIFRSGRRELFRGFLPSAIRDAPYAGLFVALYESFKKQMSSLNNSTSMLSSAGVHTVSAAGAGAIATLATHPFDVIKTKVQVRQEDRYHSLRCTIRTIWMQRGISGFFDGASLRVSRKVFSSTIGWVVYEGLLMMWQKNANART